MKSQQFPITVGLLSTGILMSISACVAYVPPPGPIAYGPPPVVQGAPLPLAPGQSPAVVAGTPAPGYYSSPYYYPPPYYYNPGYYGPGYYGPGVVLGFGGWRGGGRR